MINVKILADSISDEGIRLTTLQLQYPRFIHSEFMTHRVFSRNAGSSRAIPVMTMVEQVRSEPVKPVFWGKNQPGMQASVELSTEAITEALHVWKMAADTAARSAEALHKLGVHKQIANRILEPFQYINVVVTSTEWTNFFDLRISPAAQPEICELATQMYKALEGSNPQLILSSGWHLPYVFEEEKEILSEEFDPTLLPRISAARCARVSYNNMDGERDLQKDFNLADTLIASKHWSPFEHQATPLSAKEWSGNFRGWKQFRKVLEG